jgi:hypothetical protein
MSLIDDEQLSDPVPMEVKFAGSAHCPRGIAGFRSSSNKRSRVLEGMSTAGRLVGT